MQRALRLETLILLDCLAEATRDAAELLMHPTFGRFTSAGGWQDDTLEKKLRILARRGVITLPDPADPRIVRLSQEGRHLARGGVDPEARWSREWDGTWRLVLFDVAEADRKIRDRLRRELGLARLGYLQGSVWISPDPLDELRGKVESIAAKPEALLFIEGRPCAGESDAAIVAGAWDFARINDAYRENLAVQATMPRPTDPPHRWRQWLERERQSWFAAVDLDPLLPHRLLPAEYLGREAHRSHRKALRLAASHIFAPPTEPVPVRPAPHSGR